MTTVLDPELDKELAARLRDLPKVVQDAIESADIEKRLRELATTHQLHIDQWQLLENEVMLTLLGFAEPERLQENIEKEAKVPADVAAVLAADISRVVFEPIRQELERELEHPAAKEREASDVEAARTQVLAGGEKTTSGTPQTEPLPPPPPVQLATPPPPPPPVQPATPPATPPTQKVIRGPASGAYVAGTPSSVRKDVVDDPYRESPQ